jgi:hypothetical protein
MTEHLFFGYGSLVNRHTHSYGPVVRATVTGWARAWRHTGARDVAFLTAVPSPGTRIDGVLAPVPAGDWAALDAREWAYVRTRAEPQRSAQIYHIPDGLHDATSTRHPILLSYLDAVVQGYEEQFGPDGVARFFATTQGWEAPVLNDRAAPRYPRACRLTQAQTALVDRMLSAAGSTVTSDVTDA